MDSFKPSPQNQSSDDASASFNGLASGAADFLKPGQIIEGKYRIISLIGQGGFGCVYKVEHILLKSLCALKLLMPAHATDAKLIRFQREAQSMSNLHHENLVRASDFGIFDEKYPYLVMDWIEGPTLADFLKKRGCLPLEEALELLIPICFAMDYVHESGIVHRDLKPGNIILARSANGTSVPKVVDFGIAKIQLGDDVDGQTLTKTGEVFGTPIYMSPEQCTGEPVDRRSDIYSLGCVLFESLTGAPPFTGKTAMETLMHHSSGKVATLEEASFGTKFPAALQVVVSRMLEKNPKLRYQSFLQVAQDLDSIRMGDYGIVSARHAALPKPAATSDAQLQKRKSTPLALGILVAGILISAIGGGIVYMTSNRQETSTPDHAASQAVPQLAAMTASTGTGSNTDSSISGTSKGLFHFREPDGDLFWINSNGKWFHHEAVGQVDTPADARAILEANDNFFLTDSNIVGFSGGFFGLLMPKASFSPEAPTMEYLTMTPLQLIRFNRCLISPRAWENLDQYMPNLRWLSFIDCQGDIKKPAKLLNPNLATDISKMKLLPQLDTLAIDHLDSPTPFLKELARNPNTKLRRLSLLRMKSFSEEDARLLGKIKSLETLDFAENSRPTLSKQQADAFFEQLTKLPHLRRLRINLHLLDPGEIKCIAECKSLNEVNLGFDDPGLEGNSVLVKEIADLDQVLTRGCHVSTYNTDEKEKDSTKRVADIDPPVLRSNLTASTDEWSPPQWFNPLNPDAIKDAHWARPEPNKPSVR